MHLTNILSANILSENIIKTLIMLFFDLFLLIISNIQVRYAKHSRVSKNKEITNKFALRLLIIPAKDKVYLSYYVNYIIQLSLFIVMLILLVIHLLVTISFLNHIYFTIIFLISPFSLAFAGDKWDFIY